MGCFIAKPLLCCDGRCCSCKAYASTYYSKTIVLQTDNFLAWCCWLPIGRIWRFEGKTVNALQHVNCCQGVAITTINLHNVCDAELFDVMLYVRRCSLSWPSHCVMICGHISPSCCLAWSPYLWMLSATAALTWSSQRCRPWRYGDSPPS